MSTDTAAEPAETQMAPETKPARHAAAGDPLRIPAIAANLLPVEIIESRRNRKVRRSVISALVAVVLALGGWYATAYFQTSVASDNLDAAEAQVANLKRQQNAYADVVRTQAESETIRTQLAAAFTTDLQWSRLFAPLQAAAPDGVKISGVSGELKSPANGGKGAAAQQQAAGATGARPIGSLTVTGFGPTKVAVAAYIDALAKVDGLANPLLGELALQDGAFQFSVRFDILDSILGGRHTRRSASPSPAAGASPAAAPSAGTAPSEGAAPAPAATPAGASPQPATSPAGES